MNRPDWIEIKVEAEAKRRTEALAALVTPGLAALLERLANDAEYVSMTDEPYRYMTVQDAETARAHAARIRGLLEE